MRNEKLLYNYIIIGTVRSLWTWLCMGQIPRSTERISSVESVMWSETLVYRPIKIIRPVSERLTKFGLGLCLDLVSYKISALENSKLHLGGSS